MPKFSNKNGFAHILIVVAIVLLVVVAGAYLYINREQYLPHGTSDSTPTPTVSIDEEITPSPVSISCDEGFTTVPLQFDDFVSIIPLGAVNPPSNVFPKGYISFYLKRITPGDFKSPPSVVNVYAPADSRLTKLTTVSEFQNGVLLTRDYKLTFHLCDDVDYSLAHVINLDDAFQPLLDDINAQTLNDCVSIDSARSTFSTCEYDVDAEIKAGELLGTAGKQDRDTLDMGVIDKRTQGYPFVNDSLWDEEYRYASCPITLYSDNYQQVLNQLMGTFDLTQRRAKQPLCGESFYDERNTASGNWLFKEMDTASPQDRNLALIKDWIDPDLELFSIGTALYDQGVDDGTYYFTPQDNGNVNRAFEQIQPDGQIYCYQTKETRDLTSSAPLINFLLQLRPDGQLVIQRSFVIGCDNFDWIIDNTAKSFKR